MLAPNPSIQASNPENFYGFHKSRESFLAEVIATLTSGGRRCLPSGPSS